jgi:hypothetical protein
MKRILEEKLVCTLCIEVTKVVVLRRPGGTDLVWLHTTLPSTFSKEVSDQPLVIQFEVAQDGALSYIRENVGSFPVEVIDEKSGSRTVIQCVEMNNG